jgi:ubiquinone/menaquinone biosynthesis C-methylase UbiE
MGDWINNAAKFEVVQYVGNVLASNSNSIIRVIDVGAGTGGNWDQLVQQHPNLELHLWEPYAQSFQILKKRFANSGVFVHQDITKVALEFDVVVSLSVLEHVSDRASHFHVVHRLLKSNGIYICVVDDGHFRYFSRNIISMIAIKEQWRTLMSKLLGARYSIGRYQSKLTTEDLLKLIKGYEFELERIDYRNLPEMKSLIKELDTHEEKFRFAQIWLELEIEMNRLLAGKSFVLEKTFPCRIAYMRKK